MKGLLDLLGTLRTVLLTLPLIYLITLSLGLVAQILLPFDRGGGMQDRLARLWARLLLAASLVRVRVLGGESLKPGGHYVFVANHSSYFDILALLVGLPAGVRFMAKASLFPIPFVGWYLRRTGHMPIDLREESVRANARQLLRAVGLIRQGRSLVVFPEGGRSVTGELGEFKAGIFLAASRAGIPVVPVAIAGSARVLPRNSWAIRPGTIALALGAPMEATGKERDRLAEFVAAVRNQIGQSLQEVQG